MNYHNSNLTDVENVGEQFRRIRKEKGMTQEQAAKLTFHTTYAAQFQKNKRPNQKMGQGTK